MAPFNPAIDNTLIKHLPTVSFANGVSCIYEPPILTHADHRPGNFMLIVSHVFDESARFVPDWIHSMTDFTTFLNNFMPKEHNAKQRRAIDSQYASSRYPGKAGPWNRVHDAIQDSSFICNTRFLFDAYHGTNPATPAYMMQFAVGQTKGAAVHAADLFPTLWNTDVNKTDLINYLRNTIKVTEPDIELGALFGFEKGFFPYYPAYLASFATSGRPQPDGLTTWSPAVQGEQLSSVMEVSLWPGWNNNYVDSQKDNSICSFWRNMSYWVENTAKPAGLPKLLAQNEGRSLTI